MKKKGQILLVLSVTIVTLFGSALPVSAAPAYQDIFDAEYYAEHYSDVKTAFGTDETALFHHYINYGIYEGRVCSEAFNVQSYRENYDDLEAAYGDNWKSYVDHYLTLGLSEGRDSGGMFDAVSYANRYPDLKAAFGYDVTSLWAHYEQFGIKEGRIAISQTVLDKWEESKKESKDENTKDTSSVVTDGSLILSGSAKDIYTTTKPEYVETDKFILYLDENITLKGNTADLINQLMQMTEEQTGLTLTANNDYNPLPFFYPQDFYPEDCFADIDPQYEKFHIYVISDEKGSSFGTVGAMILNQFDLNIAEGEGWSIVQLYTGALQYANGVSLDPIMDYGYATYICGQVIKENPDFYFNFNTNLNYSFYDRKITAENAEAIYLEEKEDYWENYLYGYRFMTFLCEEYGEQVFYDILTDATKGAGQWEYQYNSEKTLPYIKANTSEDVFAVFADWLEENKERIEAWMYEDMPSETPEDDTSEETTGEIQAPLVLSGNAEDVYTTTKPEYIESDRFIIFMEEGITVNGNIVELLDQLMVMTEEETGLSISTDNGLINMNNINGANWLFGDYFTNIDPNCSKFHIYVVSPETWGSSGTAGCVILNNIDLDIAGGEGWVFVHEYTHALQLTNYGCMGRVMDEGFATYTCGQVVNNNPDFYFNFNADFNYAYYDREITAENAEAIFVEEKTDGWEDYLYGYRFMTFLQEEYGAQVVQNILTDATSNEGTWACGDDSSLVVPYIKAHTSEDIFTKYANWLEENKERIEAWSYES